jgi:hypothetical protein
LFIRDLSAVHMLYVRDEPRKAFLCGGTTEQRSVQRSIEDAYA